MNIINAGNIIMNTYVYEASCGFIMIDTGYEHSLKDVKKKLEKKNIKLSDIKYIFLTHAHDDHAGFLNEFLKVNQEAKVIISPYAMPTLKRGQNSFEGGCSGIIAFLFCKLMGLFGKANHCFPKIDDQYDDRFIKISHENKNELEDILQGEILFTPGHTKDSISLKIVNMIFCGDAAMNGIPSIKRHIIWIEDKEEYKKSWEIMMDTSASMIYPAHGKPFKKEDLLKYIKHISKIKLYRLK